MRVPPFLLAAALALWGLRGGALWAGAALAALLEAARWVRWRFDFSDRDFHRIADASALAFLGVAAYQFEALGVRGIYRIIVWLPAVLALPMAAQLYSTRDSIGYDALFLSVRRAVARGALRDPGRVDFRVPFLIVTLVSAGLGRHHAGWYLPGVCAVLALALWANRPRALGTWVWGVAAAAGIGLGVAGVEGVVAARRALEPLLMEFFHDRLLAYRDPYRAYTAMGEIGRLKSSERIVARVMPTPGQPPPPRLREATYQTLARNVWLASGTRFRPLTPTTDGTAWPLREGSVPFRRVTVSRRMPRGKGLVALPPGTFRVDELPVEDLLVNRLGTLKVLQGPELVEYHARYRPDAAGIEADPLVADLTVPRGQRATIEAIAGRLGLAGLTPREAVAAIRRYFDDGFRYSVVLRRPVRDAEPLTSFLTETRTGHCELFASATVLLLRAAGIPARYATGWAVTEWSDLEQAWIVRRRHAHAWAIAHVEGRWIDVDTTPAVWAALEAAEPPWWRGAYDALSYGLYRFARWRHLGTEETGLGLVVWLGVPLALYLAWRLSTSRRVRRATDADLALESSRAPVAPGLDSELYLVAERLRGLGLERAPGETLRRWLARLAERGQLPGWPQLRDAVLPLHYRYRFDPAGLAPPEREALREAVRAWLDRHGARLTPRGAGERGL